MKSENMRQILGKTFLNIAQGIETGNFNEKIKIGLTTLGSEHGTKNLVLGAELANRQNKSFEVILIGPKVETELEVIEADTEDQMYKKMEALLDEGYLSACVTMHYNFPIGVSTVGKVITPACGKEMFLATTTGTASSHRTEAMIYNTLYGIITAKAMGIKKPTVGILNLDGARQVQRVLKELQSNGYPICFAESIRSDGGFIMRGNDLLRGTCDVMVTDTLTGNIMMKVFSSYTTGGSYEALGCGYGPGIGEDYKRLILILSRASGIPVVAHAIEYAAALAHGKVQEIIKEEFKKVRMSGLDEILKPFHKEDKAIENDENIKMPDKQIVTSAIQGIDIMDLEDAVHILWKQGIYAESGMGCTGPVILVHEQKEQEAMKMLKQSKYVSR